MRIDRLKIIGWGYIIYGLFTLMSDLFIRSTNAPYYISIPIGAFILRKFQRRFTIIMLVIFLIHTIFATNSILGIPELDTLIMLFIIGFTLFALWSLTRKSIKEEYKARVTRIPEIKKDFAISRGLLGNLPLKIQILISLAILLFVGNLIYRGFGEEKLLKRIGSNFIILAKEFNGKHEYIKTPDLGYSKFTCVYLGRELNCTFDWKENASVITSPYIFDVDCPIRSDLTLEIIKKKKRIKITENTKWDDLVSKKVIIINSGSNYTKAEKVISSDNLLLIKGLIDFFSEIRIRDKQLVLHKDFTSFEELELQNLRKIIKSIAEFAQVLDEVN